MSSQKDYFKKQQLISKYYQKIKDLEVERTIVNSKLKACKEKFEELINIEADLDQLSLFENLDSFLIEE